MCRQDWETPKYTPDYTRKIKKTINYVTVNYNSNGKAYFLKVNIEI